MKSAGDGGGRLEDLDAVEMDGREGRARLLEALQLGADEGGVEDEEAAVDLIGVGDAEVPARTDGDTCDRLERGELLLREGVGGVFGGLDGLGLGLFRGVVRGNAEGFGDYAEEGLLPDFQLSEPYGNPLGELGTEDDLLMQPILIHMMTGAFPTIDTATRATTGRRGMKVIGSSIADKPKLARAPHRPLYVHP